MGLSQFFFRARNMLCVQLIQPPWLECFLEDILDKFNGIDVVIYHIFSHEIDWLSRLDVLLKKSPKM